jgi:hypothetical protein
VHVTVIAMPIELGMARCIPFQQRWPVAEFYCFDCDLVVLKRKEKKRKAKKGNRNGSKSSKMRIRNFVPNNNKIQMSNSRFFVLFLFFVASIFYKKRSPVRILKSPNPQLRLMIRHSHTHPNSYYTLALAAQTHHTPCAMHGLVQTGQSRV